MPLMQIVFPATTLEPARDQSASGDKVFDLEPPGDPELPPPPDDAGVAPKGDGDDLDILLWDIIDGATPRSGQGPSASDAYHDDTSALRPGQSDLADADSFVFAQLPDIDDPNEPDLPDPGDAGGAPKGDDGADGGDLALCDIIDSLADISGGSVETDLMF